MLQHGTHREHVRQQSLQLAEELHGPVQRGRPRETHGHHVLGLEEGQRRGRALGVLVLDQVALVRDDDPEPRYSRLVRQKTADKQQSHSTR